MSEKGYSPGTQVSFYPSTGAQWTEKFNAMMVERNINRTRLTNELLEFAVNVKTGDSVVIDVTGLTPEQIAILNGEGFQQLLRGFIVQLSGLNLGAKSEPVPPSTVSVEVQSQKAEVAATTESMPKQPIVEVEETNGSEEGLTKFEKMMKQNPALARAHRMRAAQVEART